VAWLQAPQLLLEQVQQLVLVFPLLPLKQPVKPNPALNRTLRDKAAQRRLALRWAYGKWLAQTA
jgi:hypothetical protein